MKDASNDSAFARENRDLLELMRKEFAILQSPAVKCREVPSFLKNGRGNWLYVFELMLQSEEGGSLNLLH